MKKITGYLNYLSDYIGRPVYRERTGNQHVVSKWVNNLLK